MIEKMPFFRIVVITAILALFPITAHAQRLSLGVICDEWPPYQIVEGNRISGFSTEIVKIVFARMNIDFISIKAYPWERAIKMIEQGAADALFSANYTKNRAEFAHYPEETIVDSPWVMWVREETGLTFGSLSDLIGKKVGVVRGYSYTSDFLDYVRTHTLYEEVANDEQNFRKLNSGRVHYIVAELRNGTHILRSLGFDKIIPLAKNPVKFDGLYLIFNKKNVPKSIADQFSVELGKLKQEPVYRTLYKTHFK
jgi:polar amino acid transport system substrate-binding protein